MMFVRHIKDNDDMLQHLFWCHGESQLNFEIFGDMIGFGFDATYRNNKYFILLSFSLVLTNIKTIIFPTALVFQETQKTYI